MENALQSLLTPPPAPSGAQALSDLTGLGAIGEGAALTMLGRHLANMPMDPKLGKALIYGALLRYSALTQGLWKGFLCVGSAALPSGSQLITLKSLAHCALQSWCYVVNLTPKQSAAAA